MGETLRIPARFNGPSESANGGYTCGLVAGLLDSEVASVSLRAPPPLERPLQVVQENDRVQLLDGAIVVAEGEPDELLLHVPGPVAPPPGRPRLAGRAPALDRETPVPGVRRVRARA
jgi:hypothetical protein